MFTISARLNPDVINIHPPQLFGPFAAAHLFDFDPLVCPSSMTHLQQARATHVHCHSFHSCGRPHCRRPGQGHGLDGWQVLSLAVSALPRSRRSGSARDTCETRAVWLRSQRSKRSAELLVDGDVHSMQEVREAIGHLERQRWSVSTKFFGPPERARNKKWEKFFVEMEISFQPVCRSALPLHEPTDVAVLSAMLNASSAGIDCVALLTSDTGFIKTLVEIQHSGTSCCAFIPESVPAVFRSFEVAGLPTIRLQKDFESNLGSKVRAILHQDGSGSVELADPFPQTSSKVYISRSKVVTDFLDNLGYGGQGYTIQSIAKFWFTNNLGNLVVYPPTIGLNAMYEIVSEQRCASWGRYSDVCKLAFILPIVACSSSKKHVRMYGNACSRRIFEGEGPFILTDSLEMVPQALNRLGYLDDGLNADLTEAMFCFVNASYNKGSLRKAGMLPIAGDKVLDVQSKLRTAFLSNDFSGLWQRQKSCLRHSRVHLVQQILVRAGVLCGVTSRDICQREVFEGMKLYVRKRGLPSMQTFNGLLWRILRHTKKNDSTKTLEVEL